MKEKYKIEAERIERRAKEICKAENLPLKSLNFTRKAFKFGFCTQRKIILNSILIECPQWILEKYFDYSLKEILFHEITHLKYKKHNKHFWKYFDYLNDKYHIKKIK